MTESKTDWTCPKCGKDMEPKPGAVLTCREEVCVFWRLGFYEFGGGAKKQRRVPSGRLQRQY